MADPIVTPSRRGLFGWLFAAPLAAEVAVKAALAPVAVQASTTEALIDAQLEFLRANLQGRIGNPKALWPGAKEWFAEVYEEVSSPDWPGLFNNEDEP